MIRRIKSGGGISERFGNIVSLFFSIAMISASACPGYSQEGEMVWGESLREVLSSYSGFGLVKIAVKSEGYMLKDEKPGNLELISECDIEAYLSVSSSKPMRLDYLLKKRRWFNGTAEFTQQRLSELIANGFSAEIKYQKGVPGNMKDNNIVVLHNKGSHHEDYNHYEVGDAFILLNQKIFREIPIMDFVDKKPSTSAVTILVEEGVLNEEKVIKIVFERNHHGHDERDMS